MGESPAFYTNGDAGEALRTGLDCGGKTMLRIAIVGTEEVRFFCVKRIPLLMK